MAFTNERFTLAADSIRLLAISGDDSIYIARVKIRPLCLSWDFAGWSPIGYGSVPVTQATDFAAIRDESSRELPQQYARSGIQDPSNRGPTSINVADYSTPPFRD
jgi:hypothetical protein